MSEIERRTTGKLRLSRDTSRRAKNTDYPGVFTLRGLSDFVVEAGVNGVPEDAHVWFDNPRGGIAPKAMYFKLESDGLWNVAPPVRVRAVPGESPRVNLALMILCFVMMFAAGIWVGVLLQWL